MRMLNKLPNDADAGIVRENESALCSFINFPDLFESMDKHYEIRRALSIAVLWGLQWFR